MGGCDCACEVFGWFGVVGKGKVGGDWGLGGKVEREGRKGGCGRFFSVSDGWRVCGLDSQDGSSIGDCKFGGYTVWI